MATDGITPPGEAVPGAASVAPAASAGLFGALVRLLAAVHLRRYQEVRLISSPGAFCSAVTSRIEVPH